MEDDKLAAYYDELTRKGGGAARFKQGLGFSSTTSSSDDAVPSRGSALPTTSSFLSSFVRASSPSKTSEFEKQAQLQSIQNKLSKKPKEKARSRSSTRDSGRRSRSPSRSPRRDGGRDKHSSRRRSRSRSQSRDGHSRRRSLSRDRRSRRRSRSREHGSRRKNRSRSRSRNRERSRDRSKRQGSPEGRRPEKSKKGGGDGGGVDFAKLIEGYDNMTSAERVKAKMKLQLSKTAENDETIGKGSGWERFDFDKDAPLDDEEIEAAEDDAALVKHMGQSFRFSAVEAKREEKIKAAHDEAMFGGSSHPPPAETDEEAGEENHKKQVIESTPAASLLSDQVLTMQQGSWRDRARKP